MAKVTKTVKAVKPKKKVKNVVVQEATPAKVELKLPTTERVELWSQDEYGQGSIIGSFNTIKDAFNRAKSYLNEGNADNALSLAEKKLNWNVYLPVLVDSEGQPDLFSVYGGNRRFGKREVAVLNNSKRELKPTDGFKFSFFLGSLENNGKVTNWYLEDHFSKPISNFEDGSLAQKEILFFKFL
jgi:hypothetical protein